MQLQVAKVAVGCNATLPYKIKKFTHTLFKGEISMKIYKIVALAFAILLCIVGVVIGIRETLFWYVDNVWGGVIIVCFAILLLKTIGNFIEAIIDCNRYYVEKRKKEIDRQIAYQRFLNQQASNSAPNYNQSQNL